MIAIFLAAILTADAASAAPSSLPAPTTLAPADQLRRAKALMLVQIVVREDMVKAGDPRNLASWRALFSSLPAYVSLEQRYPGAIDAIADAVEPVVSAQRSRRLPQLRERLADLYAANLTSAELDQSIAFYSSSTGRKFVALFLGKMGADARIADIRKNPEVGPGLDAIMSDMRAAAPSVLAGLSPSEKASLRVFSHTSACAKYRVLAPQVQLLQLAWKRESTPEDKKEMADVIRATIAKIKQPKQ